MRNKEIKNNTISEPIMLVSLIEVTYEVYRSDELRWHGIHNQISWRLISITDASDLSCMQFRVPQLRHVQIFITMDSGI